MDSGFRWIRSIIRSELNDLLNLDVPLKTDSLASSELPAGSSTQLNRFTFCPMWTSRNICYCKEEAVVPSACLRVNMVKTWSHVFFFTFTTLMKHHSQHYRFPFTSLWCLTPPARDLLVLGCRVGGFVMWCCGMRTDLAHADRKHGQIWLSVTSLTSRNWWTCWVWISSTKTWSPDFLRSDCRRKYIPDVSEKHVVYSQGLSSVKNVCV